MSNINLAKSLLAWNKQYLKSNSHLKKENIAECFADTFVVKANGRQYEADHDNYLEFLNGFKSTIKSIDYEIDEYTRYHSICTV